MGKIAALISLFAVLFFSAGCERGPAKTPAPRSTAEISQATSSGKKTVVFFMNPAGIPCGQQNEILKKLFQDRGGNFNVAYVSVMRPEDEKAFYDYGIRSLPSLVLVDSSGNIGRQFPPGIQPYDTLAQALDSMK
jgi:thioredoxin-like negative regulator of GroEL